MFYNLSDNDFYWFAIAGGIIFFGILYSISMCYYDYSLGKKKEINNDSPLKNENKFINYTFVATKYKFDPNKENSKGYCVNNVFNINHVFGLQQYRAYFSDPSNTLLLFEGNRIGLFLSKSELDIIPALYYSLIQNNPSGYCTDVLKTTDSCSILIMDYVPSNKAWMLLSLPALLNVPIEDDEDNSMYPAEMVVDAKSDWAQYILDMIEQEWDDGNFSESPNSENLNDSRNFSESPKSSNLNDSRNFSESPNSSNLNNSRNLSESPKSSNLNDSTHSTESLKSDKSNDENTFNESVAMGATI